MEERKPRFVDPAGLEGDHAAVPNSPPFVFHNVTARVFPLKANMARLRHFIDQYLNMDIPHEIVHFRPTIPFVYLIMLNYGRLAPATIEAQNIGWISQNEVVFAVPLERWERHDGRMVFKNWASVSPFIFVDDVISQTTGREVYGWPKVHAEIDAETPLWTKDPRSQSRLLSLKTKIIPDLFAGYKEENRQILQIHQESSPFFTQIPADPWNPWFPLSALRTAVSGWWDVLGYATDIVSGMPIRGYPGNRDLANQLRMLYKAGDQAKFFLSDLLQLSPNQDPMCHAKDANRPEVGIDQITLKQFPHPGKPFEACYQGIVSSYIGLTCLNRFGLLGDEFQLRGDPSGGFTIRIYRYDAQPIVECLGLEQGRDEEGEFAPVSIFKPVFPFWADTDMYYGKGETLCSRPVFGKESVFCSKASPNEEYAAWCAFSYKHKDSFNEPLTVKNTVIPRKFGDEKIPFNTVRGGATQPISGPFIFPDVTIQVYPLAANPEKLQSYLDAYLNTPLGTLEESNRIYFETLGSYVYLTVTIYGDESGKMWSALNNIGWWIEKEVAFNIPVKCYKGKKPDQWETTDHEKLLSLGFVAPFMFSHTGRAVISDREISGRPTVKANIKSFPDVWLDPSGPIAERKLIKMDSEIYPGRYMAQKAEDRTLLEISQIITQKPGVPNPSVDTSEWDSFKPKRALALEVLANDQPMNWFHLKQHRDSHHTERLCYQSLVKTSRTITQINNIEKMDEDIFIHIHKYPGRPIVDLLGLKTDPKKDNTSGKSRVQVVEAKNPFWMRISSEEGLGTVLCLRTMSEAWTVPSNSWLTSSREGLSYSDLPFLWNEGVTPVQKDDEDNLDEDNEDKLGVFIRSLVLAKPSRKHELLFELRRVVKLIYEEAQWLKALSDYSNTPHPKTSEIDDLIDRYQARKVLAEMNPQKLLEHLLKIISVH